jgi:peptidoglycan hydrolase-like protein with peptidoglycan-binding domain
MGLYDGAIDGIYGPKTRKAVNDFQAQSDLPKSGRLDAATREKLQQHASAAGTAAPSRTAPSSGSMPGGEPAQPQQSQ